MVYERRASLTQNRRKIDTFACVILVVYLGHGIFIRLYVKQYNFPQNTVFGLLPSPLWKHFRLQIYLTLVEGRDFGALKGVTKDESQAPTVRNSRKKVVHLYRSTRAVR